MALATRELELIIIAKDHTKATLARIGGAMAILGAGLTAVGLKGVKELGSMTMEAIEFKQQMALAVTQADGLGATIDNVGEIVNRVGTNINVPFEGLSDSLFDIFSTFTSDQLSSLEQAEEILDAFGRSAVAGQAPIRDIGRAVIAWINALDQPATLENVTKILDIQFELVRKGAGTYEEFASQVGKAIPAFVAAGQDVATFGGSMAFLTKNGLTAAMAATSAARAVELMFTPKAIKGLGVIGVAVEDGSGNFRQMNEIIRDLIPIFDGLSDSARKIKFKEIFGTGRIQARRFFDLAIPNIAEFEELIQDMNMSAGESAKAFELLFSQPLSQIELFQNRWESLRRTIGEAFISTLEDDLFPILQRLWDWWQKLDPEMQAQIAKWLSWAAAATVVAGAILTVMGFFVLFLGLMKIFSGTTAIAGLTKLAISLGWIGVVIAIIAGLALLIFKNWDKIAPFLIDIWDRVREAAMNFFEDNKEFFEDMLKKAKEIWDKLLKLGITIWEAHLKIWQDIWGTILVMWELWGEDIMKTLSNVWEEIKTIFLAAMDIIIGIIDFFIALFSGDWEGMWEAVKNIASAGWEIIKSIFMIAGGILSQIWRIVWDKIKEVAATAWNGIVNFFKDVWKKIKKTASDIWGGIVNFFKGIWDKLTGTARDTIEGKGGLLEFFQELPGKIVDAMFAMASLMIEWSGKALGAMLEGFISFLPTLFIFLIELPGRMVALFVDMLQLLFNIGKTVLRGLWNGIKWLWNNEGLKQWIIDLPGMLLKAIGFVNNLLFNIGKEILKGMKAGLLWAWKNLVIFWLKGIGNAIKRNIGNLWSTLWDAGRAVINGLLAGLKSAWSKVTTWVKEKAGWLGTAWRIITRITSPSKEFMEIGMQLMKGLEIGLDRGWNPVQMSMRGFANQMIDPISSHALNAIPSSASTVTNNNDHGQTLEFGDIVSNADPMEIAAEIAWLVRMS